MSDQLTLAFPGAAIEQPLYRSLAPGAALLRGFALDREQRLFDAVERLIAEAPLRHLITPGGFRMSVAMSNCGALGWVSDTAGYRYTAIDPIRNAAWPSMPASLRELACAAAHRAGFPAFEPDACLVNRYQPGARLSLHQDQGERHLDAPIVSVSLGLPATFLFGGANRSDKPERIPLVHGDVVVWGGPARLRFHGVLPVAAGRHRLFGAQRINLTFRKAG